MQTDTDIHTAAWKGDIKALRKILSSDHSLARAADETLYGGERPLETISALLNENV